MLTIDEVASVMGVHHQTVRRWVKRGDLATGATPGGQRRVPITALSDFLDRTGRRVVNRRTFGFWLERLR